MKNKKIFGKKQFFAALLLLALGGAVWLNMQYSGGAGGFVIDTTSHVKNLGDTKYVNNASVTAVETSATVDELDAVAAERAKTREEALSLLEDTLNNTTADKAAKKQAMDKMAEIASRMEKEASIEALIKAKGFDRVVVLIGERDVNVIVRADELLPSQTLQIQDAVASITEISLQNVKIVNKK